MKSKHKSVMCTDLNKYFCLFVCLYVASRDVLLWVENVTSGAVLQFIIST